MTPWRLANYAFPALTWSVAHSTPCAHHHRVVETAASTQGRVPKRRLGDMTTESEQCGAMEATKRAAGLPEHGARSHGLLAEVQLPRKQRDLRSRIAIYM